MHSLYSTISQIQLVSMIKKSELWYYTVGSSYSNVAFYIISVSVLFDKNAEPPATIFI